MVRIGWAGAVDPVAADLHRKDEVERLLERPLFVALRRNAGIGVRRLAVDGEDDLVGVPLASVGVPVVAPDRAVPPFFGVLVLSTLSVYSECTVW